MRAEVSSLSLFYSVCFFFFGGNELCQFALAPARSALIFIFLLGLGRVQFDIIKHDAVFSEHCRFIKRSIESNQKVLIDR